ncbi:uncharacterized protein LOC129602588 [Paramacrobiotus metropolitanus]|uniref:uncharacterized protein LOC129602588 n=1 Tax=Paramacrobiotus metropolitanus TaxID=2943436 RepID=UPI00244625AA|nr:uncharacterized protein LOC129602588 [Paramacrobiotus metropolitanus]
MAHRNSLSASATIVLGIVALVVCDPDVEKKNRDLSLDADVTFSQGFASAGSSGGGFSSRAGSLSEWCSVAFGIPCRASGTECKGGAAVADLVASPSNQGTGHTEFCLCKNGYEKATSSIYDNRCRALVSAIPDPTNAECEYPEDCANYEGKAPGSTVCRMEPNKLIGRCQCGTEYVYDRGIPGCRVYDCLKDGDAKCKQDRGANAQCTAIPGSPATCGCKSGFMLLYDPLVGRQQCRDLATFRCDATNLCPAASGTTCNSTGRCECPKNQVLMTQPGSNGQSVCKALAIGSIGCTADSNCPERAVCQRGGGGAVGICLCQDYHKATSSNNGCQLAVGMCCKTSSDCGELRNATALPLSCVRNPSTATRGVCLCQGVGQNAWDIDRCKAATC